MIRDGEWGKRFSRAIKRGIDRLNSTTSMEIIIKSYKKDSRGVQRKKMQILIKYDSGKEIEK